MSDTKDEKVEEIAVFPISIPSTRRPSITEKKPNMVRRELAIFMAEFIGTFMFFFTAFVGAQLAVNSAGPYQFVPEGESPAPETPKLLYISFSFGFALMINVAVFADISGGMFNPAVTAALWLVGKLTWLRAIHSVLAQLLAGILSAFVVDAIIPGDLTIQTAMDPSTSVIRALFVEMFFTAQLIIVILMLPAGPTKPMYVGFTLFAAQLGSVFFSGGSLNPARSIGPAIIGGFVSSDWIYWFGPALGAGLASGTYALINVVKADEF